MHTHHIHSAVGGGAGGGAGGGVGGVACKQTKLRHARTMEGECHVPSHHRGLHHDPGGVLPVEPLLHVFLQNTGPIQLVAQGYPVGLDIVHASKQLNLPCPRGEPLYDAVDLVRFVAGSTDLQGEGRGGEGRGEEGRGRVGRGRGGVGEGRGRGRGRRFWLWTDAIAHQSTPHHMY